jgi:uncharacterized protein
MQVPMSEEEKAGIKKLLADAKAIAVVGLSPDEDRDSNRVAKYLIAAGYDVIPVYPKEETILGQKVYRSLAEIERAVDVVNIFRKADALAAVADEAIKIAPKLVWAQIGCYDDAAEAKVREAGIAIVSHRCLMVEHRKLFG